MNSEHDEAAAVDRLARPRLDKLRAAGGVLMGRRVKIDSEGELELQYVVVMPLAVDRVKVELCVARLP